MEFSFAYFGHFLPPLYYHDWSDYYQIWEMHYWIFIEDIAQLSTPYKEVKYAFLS